MTNYIEKYEHKPFLKEIRDKVAGWIVDDKIGKPVTVNFFTFHL